MIKSYSMLPLFPTEKTNVSDHSWTMHGTKQPHALDLSLDTICRKWNRECARTVKTCSADASVGYNESYTPQVGRIVTDPYETKFLELEDSEYIDSDVGYNCSLLLGKHAELNVVFSGGWFAVIGALKTLCAYRRLAEARSLLHAPLRNLSHTSNDEPVYARADLALLYVNVVKKCQLCDLGYRPGPTTSSEHSETSSHPGFTLSITNIFVATQAVSVAIWYHHW